MANDNDRQSPRLAALDYMQNPPTDDVLHELGKLAEISGNPLVAGVEANYVASVAFRAMTVIRRLQKEIASQ